MVDKKIRWKNKYAMYYDTEEEAIQGEKEADLRYGLEEECPETYGPLYYGVIKHKKIVYELLKKFFED